MRKRIGGIVATVLFMVGVVVIFAYSQLTSFEVERITDDVHVIYGLGGNVGILATERGTIVVDTKAFKFHGKQIREHAQELGGDSGHGKVRFRQRPRGSYASQTQAGGDSGVAEAKCARLKMRVPTSEYIERGTRRGKYPRSRLRPQKFQH